MPVAQSTSWFEASWLPTQHIRHVPVAAGRKLAGAPRISGGPEVAFDEWQECGDHASDFAALTPRHRTLGSPSSQPTQPTQAHTNHLPTNQASSSGEPRDSGVPRNEVVVVQDGAPKKKRFSGGEQPLASSRQMSVTYQGLGSGDYAFRVRARDAADNVGGASEPLSFSVDSSIGRSEDSGRRDHNFDDSYHVARIIIIVVVVVIGESRMSVCGGGCWQGWCNAQAVYWHTLAGKSTALIFSLFANMDGKLHSTSPQLKAGRGFCSAVPKFIARVLMDWFALKSPRS